MATAQTFDGVLAVSTCNDTAVGSLDYYTKSTIDIFVIKGYSNPMLTSSISIPLPSGCAGFSFVFPQWQDDGSLYVSVTASSDSTQSAAFTNVNNMKEQLHRYTVTDDGQVTLVWRSTESLFMGSGQVGWPQLTGGEVFVTRDGSWGVWGTSLFDAGTGVINFDPITNYTDPDTDQVYLAYAPTYSYTVPSGIANCLLRIPYPWMDPDTLHVDAVTFDKTVVRSATWNGRSAADLTGLVDNPSDYDFSSLSAFKAYQDPYLNMALIWEYLPTGDIYQRYGYVDMDTYMPGLFGPLIDTQGQGSKLLADRLPGGGIGLSPFPDNLLIVKKRSDGFYVAANSRAVVQPGGLIPQNNGLGFAQYQDPARYPHYGTNFTLGWFDTDGAFTAFGSGTLTQEPRNSFVFRPILPIETATGYIDATRRLFTAV